MSEEEFYLRRDLFLNELDKQNIDYIYEDYIQKEKEYKKEIERLNNIINECAEDILKELEENHHLSYGVALAIRQKLLDYKELKGDDKE